MKEPVTMLRRRLEGTADQRMGLRRWRIPMMMGAGRGGKGTSVSGDC